MDATGPPDQGAFRRIRYGEGRNGLMRVRFLSRGQIPRGVSNEAQPRSAELLLHTAQELGAC